MFLVVALRTMTDGSYPRATSDLAREIRWTAKISAYLLSVLELLTPELLDQYWGRPVQASWALIAL
jgi:hypothetical protein